MAGAASASVLFLLALAGAFVFSYRCHYTSYQAARVQGQRLLFVAASWAIGLLALSRASILLVENRLSENQKMSISEQWQYVTGPLHTPALATFFVAFLWGLLLPSLINAVYRKGRASARAIRKHGGELEKLLYRAMDEELLVSITLENRKAYIGWPVFTPDPRHNTEDFRILPSLSGHRLEDTMGLQLTTDYNRVYALIKRRRSRDPDYTLKARDFEIAIPLEQIVTVNLFSARVNQDWFKIPTADGRNEPQMDAASDSGLLQTLLILLAVWGIIRDPEDN
ncbi:hypothetical protein GBA63_02845 [Rubrobacter tropicus]|uniref:Uncharacterized protein n=1 Tax=Rubrobacter tropicus TaxID=2653851 RepID=A0A6G8Q5T4_9ACTN|nr:hypothetical protein [Rubrobacter tropicus]QIN81687.1 hypothetical protein GBA63_02845 [Rubrobacter tropicus]